MRKMRQLNDDKFSFLTSLKNVWRKKMRARSTRDRMSRRRKIARWQKPRTGSFIEDCIIGNKAVMKWLRSLSEEHEKQLSASASQKSS
ncbi:hypothetical protein QUF54_07455 [Candidatus Marithioploca araucensis]|uniref:Uncharacterized protein n=1 Tax=Candidatus Marithioploca araucensis TaxID=70273 RepID=A0ABT7VUE2_9GAMM|nr:hypothetical protein [Candidatus Marithioploca araucensis]